MKKQLLLVLMLCCSAPAFSQVFKSLSGRITFLSSTSLQTIQAVNNETVILLNGKNGDLQLSLPIKSFKFENALMQEHFNEQYMESDKYPMATFKGAIQNWPAISLTKDGFYEAQAKGSLTIHGVTKEVLIKGTMAVKNGIPAIDATFTVKCSDYGIQIPQALGAKIADEIRITITGPINPVSR